MTQMTTTKTPVPLGKPPTTTAIGATPAPDPGPDSVKELALKPKDPMRIGDRGVVMRSVEDLAAFAKVVIESGLAPQGFEKPQQVFIAVQMGMELGLSPMASLRTICVINGRACIWGEGKLGLIRQSGLLAQLEETISGEGDNRTATCRVWRKGQQEPSIGTFSMAQAAKAGLVGKDNWKKYPDRMLTHRARYALNDAFPDVLFGLMSVEEAQDLAPVFDPDKAHGADKAEALVEKLRPSDVAPTTDGNVHPPPEPAPPAPTEAPLSALDELAAHISDQTGLLPAACIDVALAWCDERKYSRNKLAQIRKIVMVEARKVDWQARVAEAAKTQEVAS